MVIFYRNITYLKVLVYKITDVFMVPSEVLLRFMMSLEKIFQNSYLVSFQGRRLTGRSDCVESRRKHTLRK